MMEIIEMRYVIDANGFGILQYRQRRPQTDASGAICGFGEFGAWMEPCYIDQDDLDRENDVR